MGLRYIAAPVNSQWVLGLATDPGFGDPAGPGGSALKTARTWARVAPLLATATNVVVKTGGGFFTREFFVEFDAPAADVKKWLHASPGTRNERAIVQAGGVWRYDIKPGGGAQFAQITLSPKGSHVRIHTYWS